MKHLKPEFVHKDNRRTLSQLLTEDIKQINLYEVSHKAVLGDHYHKETTEYFLITKGSFILQTGNYKSKLYSARVVNKGSLLCIDPYERHTIECLSPEGQFLTFLSKPYTKDSSDTFKE